MRVTLSFCQSLTEVSTPCSDVISTINRSTPYIIEDINTLYHQRYILHHLGYICPQCLLPGVCCLVCSLWSDRGGLMVAWWSRHLGSQPGDSASPPRPITTTRRQTAAALRGTRSATGASAGSAVIRGTSPGQDGWAETLMWYLLGHLQDKLVILVLVRSKVFFQILKPSGLVTVKFFYFYMIKRFLLTINSYKTVLSI